MYGGDQERSYEKKTYNRENADIHFEGREGGGKEGVGFHRIFLIFKNIHISHITL